METRFEKQRVLVNYKGVMDSVIADQLRLISEKYGGVKSGEWEQTEDGSKCLFTFRSLFQVDQFRIDAQRNVDFKISIGFV